MIRFSITSGGNKHQLFMQLQMIGLADDKGKVIAHSFFVQALIAEDRSAEFRLRVSSIAAADKTGDEWNIAGDLGSDDLEMDNPRRLGRIPLKSKFRARYNTALGTGTLVIEPPKTGVYLPETIVL